VHQYQIPTIGEAIKIPSQGKSGSDKGLHSAYCATFSPAKDRNSFHPPSKSSPIQVTAADPMI
tara:strand:+ start:96 stop:284 length:189 start_codon:yes stop_codon:yes gene_type:complete